MDSYLDTYGSQMSAFKILLKQVIDHISHYYLSCEFEYQITLTYFLTITVIIKKILTMKRINEEKNNIKSKVLNKTKNEYKLKNYNIKNPYIILLGISKSGGKDIIINHQ